MMTRYAAAALLGMAAPALANEVQFVPLQDYIGQTRVTKDPGGPRLHSGPLQFALRGLRERP
jgi:hypothetical protein